MKALIGSPTTSLTRRDETAGTRFCNLKETNISDCGEENEEETSIVYDVVSTVR